MICANKVEGDLRMKVALRKISASLILMSCVFALTFTGCGNASTENTETSEDETSVSNQDDSNQDEENQTESDDTGDDSAEEYTELVFGDLDNLGNNPNNLNQCPGGIAFDDEYIYFADQSTGNLQNNSISRVRYDGTGYEVLPISDASYVGSHDDSLLLNIMDGYLYYVAADNIIKRYEIETGDIEIVMQSETNPAEITNMLIVDGYLYVVTDLGGDAYANKLEKSARVDVCDLNTFGILTVFEEDELGETPIVTSDGKDVFFIYSTSYVKLYSIDIDKIDSYFETQSESEYYSGSVVLETVGDSYYLKPIIFAKNGFMELLTTGESLYHLQIDYTGVSYLGETFGIVSSFGNYDVDAGQDNYYMNSVNSGTGRRFAIGDSFILISLGVDENGAASSSIHDVVLFNNMDLTTPEVIYTSVGYWDYSMFGIHDDVLYLIEFESKTGPVNLITIDVEGQVSTVSIS